MKKKWLSFLGAAVMMTMLVSCGPAPNAATVETSESAENAPPVSASPEPTDSVGTLPVPTPATPALLTADEARAICIAWLDSQADVPSYSLIEWSDGLYPSHRFLGEAYYSFVVAGMPVSWFKILVHIETGEAFFEMRTQGDRPQTTVAPLVDWDGWEHVAYPTTLLTVEEAITFYDTWRGSRANTSRYTLDDQSYEHFILFDEPYLLLHAEDASMYWYHVLVHGETGELLFLGTEDGQYPVTSIVLLDDWYDSISGP